MSRNITGGRLSPVTLFDQYGNQIGENNELPVTPGSGTFNVAIAAQDSPSIDSFSRWRVSNTASRGEVMFTLDKQAMLFDEEASGTGAASHDADLRAVYLSTGGTASGAKMALRHHYHIPYTPGSSQLVIPTGTFNPDNTTDWTNVQAEIGYGNAWNGVGFRYTSSGASVFLRSSISGSTEDLAAVSQADWDTKHTDVDWDTSQIMVMDFQSLAVGRIRFYLDRGGVLQPVHEIVNDNIRKGPYWQIASLPPYWSVENLDVANEIVRILAICMTVKSEGGPSLFDIPGFPFAAYATATKSVGTSFIPIVSIRLKSTFNSIRNTTLVIPKSIQAYSAANGAMLVPFLNPTLTSPNWVDVDPNSAVEKDISASAISDGRPLPGFFVAGGNRGGESGNLTGRVPLSLDSTLTTSDILSVAAVRTDASNASVWAMINYEEIR